MFVDGVYRPDLSMLGNVTGADAWRAGSIHNFADDPELQVRVLRHTWLCCDAIRGWGDGGLSPMLYRGYCDVVVRV